MKKLNDSAETLKYVSRHRVEAAFINIELNGMDGLQLGEKLRELNPKIVLVFFIEHTEYILEALRIKADGYMIRPYTMEDLTWTMGNAKLLSRRQKKPAYIRTFGRFDLFINGELVIFSNKKAKELLEKAGYNNEKLVLVTTPDYQEMYNATLVVQEQLKKAGINAEVESYDFSTFMEHRADPKQYSMFITSNSYNMLPIQLSVLDKGWAGLDRPEVTEGIQKIRSAANEEEASAAWADLQTFLYEYGAATVLGHYTGISAMRAEVEDVGYLRFPIYWNATTTK